MLHRCEIESLTWQQHHTSSEGEIEREREGFTSCIHLTAIEMALHQSWAFVFGILGNVVSFLVSIAPLPTFYQIYKKKTSEGFQSIPYVVSLFSAMLWIYYALLKKDAMLLITINTFCCFIQSFYIITYLYYGPKKEKVMTVKFILLFNVFGFGVIFLSTFFLHNPSIRLHILGYICMAFGLGVFAAPLAIVRKVIKTKSVEYMPFTLSVFLTLAAVMWFFYGFMLNDKNIAVPNVVGFIFGILQMILYAIYKNHPKVEDPKVQQPEHIIDVVKLGTVVCSEVNAVAPLPNHTNNNNNNGGFAETETIKENTTDASNKV
ncbi:bidirectional sugar transporter SWEET10-like [Durio zibethinus]|uniref:Bidirectional sugar transporter SWEET n=1 Tax=Durio zibethinus TaxID=66656 RepID=A0A6P5Y8Z5_DURZI|nr:bidirectional sugar transporter SWEET10-like [Durio zibethinus]